MDWLGNLWEAFVQTWEHIVNTWDLIDKYDDPTTGQGTAIRG
jgi:hypothetical protein